MPRILKINTGHSEEDVIGSAAAIISRGGVIAYPTETIYGLGADATNEQAIRKIFEIKGRNFSNPVSLIIGRREDVHPLVRAIPKTAQKLMDAFWPGPLTIVFEAAGCVSPLLTAKTGKIGIRLSGHDGARQIALAAGKPLTATSANLSGLPECATADEVIAQLGDRLDAVVDLGNTSGTAGSTIIDTTTEQPVILRAGVISREEILQKTGI
ncbi:MAG TPA: L-threonylcarbamoyladenylate synthase [Smithellaceae bacterium]|jgi:L-threonylcarbamoyladenylate synthase|nr:threonylcarbamoyl-AMP synthase [Syntrophaceae bacterium]NMC90116.1 threonylcarbamoyl-AMP synthase [Smithella sp.]HNV56495.1 L-threonylcarbamoyladenylate synthase [Smithellaceae bacterium]MBP8665700.1 threonylcarbamoyl-AMP synthase [Syntrophaceae bacterium]HNY96135.1 L-threonylcarbamoyladenylate synthase [Smithellaceae bacterium]